MNSFVFAILTTLILSSSSLENITEHQKLINYINDLKTTWIAAKNFVPNFPKISKNEKYIEDNSCYIFHKIIKMIPESFDSRTAWPFCESINDIRAQGKLCFSCWAFAAVEVMSDRICIHSGGTTKVKLSPEDVLSCCPNCGNCSIGYTSKVWQHWIRNGIVTGGDLESNEGCKPYTQQSYNGTVPTCEKKCQKNYPIPYEQDKYYGEKRYYVAPIMEQIQTEIMLNGPVEALFSVYDDFNHYKSGVYQHVSGDYIIDHFVKIIGWGVEGETLYWLAANSWGKNWGNKGFFKILRGVNHLGIEHQIDAGMPARKCT